MLHDILFLIMGLVLIIAGGNALTDGAEAIARHFRISEIVIGLTVVAFGSSTPDFVVCFMSDLSGKPELAIGDIVGANIFDLLLVVGLVALIRPIPIGTGMGRKDLPMLLLSSICLFICGDDVLFDRSAANIISRTDGLMLLAFFCIFIGYTLSMRNEKPRVLPASAAADEPKSEIEMKRISERLDEIKSRMVSRFAIRPRHSSALKPQSDKKRMWMSAVMIVCGLGALVVGGNWIVDGASGIALKAGMSEAMVGLTVVALGSSMPDIATSVIAALKNQPGIALGNVVGACVFNVFFIIGLSATAIPMNVGHVNWIDFATLLLGSVLLIVYTFDSKTQIIGRNEGISLVALYALYFAYLIVFKP